MTLATNDAGTIQRNLSTCAQVGNSIVSSVVALARHGEISCSWPPESYRSVCCDSNWANYSWKSPQQSGDGKC